MNERIVIGPKESLIETLIARMELRGNDFSYIAVVFPGRRPAHFLRKELSHRVGGSFIPPKIFSIDDFVQSMYQLIKTGPVNDLEPIDAVTLLYQVHNELKERLGGDYFNTLDSFIPIGLKLFGELEELKLAQLSEKRLNDSLSSLTYNRLFSFPEYYERFYSLAAEKGFSTRAMRYDKVAGQIDKINLEEYKQLFIIRLFRLSPAERNIFDALEKRPDVYSIYQTDKLQQDAKGPEINFIKAPDTHGQVFALSAIIKKQIEERGKIDERSVIVLPTPEALFPLVHQTLSLLPQEGYNISIGYPVARTPVFGFLNNLMELICTKQANRYSASHYVKFILHPYTKNIRFGHRTDVTRILFHAVESMLVEDTSKILITLEEIEGADKIFTDVASAISESGDEVKVDDLKEHLRKIHTQTVRALGHIGTLKEFAHKSISVLNYIYEQSTARFHPLFRPYAEAVIETFLKLERSLAGDASLHDMDGYFNFLKKYIALQAVPFTGTPLRGLQVLGLLETRGLRFDNVYLLNANDNFLPGGIGNDMLLPQKLRKDLELETRRDRDALSEYYFNLLVRGAGCVHIFFEESGENDKSRFIEKLIWERQKRDKTYESDAYIKTVHYKVNLAGETVESIQKSQNILTVSNGLVYSASSLDTYLQCPIKFYYRYILKLEEKEEAGADPDSKDIGLFVHEVLKKFYDPFVGMKLEMQNLDSMRMEMLIDEMFAQKFGTESVGPAYLLKRQIKKQLKAMLTDYQQKVLENNNVVLVSLEEKISVQSFGCKFGGQIDRIEQRGDKIFILDYKTGAIPAAKPVNFKKIDLEERETWNEAITSLQLPVYLLLYSLYSKIAPERITPLYLYLGENRLGMESEVSFVDDESMQVDNFNIVQKLIKKIIDEIQDASKPFSPPSNLSKACPRCPFTTLCGTEWVQG